MPTNPYYVDGKRVPGVTTIISKCSEKGGLKWWAAKLAANMFADEIRKLDELPTENDLARIHDLAYYAHRNSVQAAATAGTIAHDMVEQFIVSNTTEFDVQEKFDCTEEIADHATTAFGGFLEWFGANKIEVTHTELPLLSQKHRFGGTLDGAGGCGAAILVKGKRSLLDWKTSNGLYVDHLIQVAGGYKILWNENFPDDQIDGGYHIVRFDKNHGGFAHHFWPDIPGADEAFLHMRGLYELLKPLEKMAK